MREVIAVTGPMASGKNYICTQLEQQGYASIDADILVHQAIEQVKDKILEKFIPYAEQQNLKLTNSDGTINRRALGQLLFSFPELLQIQESIVYPIIIQQILEFINQHEKSIINTKMRHTPLSTLYIRYAMLRMYSKLSTNGSTTAMCQRSCS